MKAGKANVWNPSFHEALAPQGSLCSFSLKVNRTCEGRTEATALEGTAPLCVHM